MQLQRLCGFKLFFKKLELNHHELQSCGVIIFGQNIYLLILFFMLVLSILKLIIILSEKEYQENY
jgi:hypothetical protein